MSIGIDYNTFMKLNPTKLESFVKAEKLKQERVDYEMWLQGQYNYIAFNTVMANFVAGLGGKRGDAEYIDMPIYKKNQEIAKERELMNDQEYMRKKTIEFLNSMSIASGKGTI